MRAIIQRVSHASVTVDNKVLSKIDEGILVLLGVGKEDTEKQAEFLADKVANLRIFCDENDKMNLSLLDIGKDAIVVSNFTLYANSRKGRRPSYDEAALPEVADRLYQYFVACMRKQNVRNVYTGEFGADMKVSLLNDGPVTIFLDTDVIMPLRKEQ